MRRLLFLLKASRPGLWFQTIWLYVLPTSHLPVWNSTWFWVGMAYVTFPLNLLVYGWNDLVDVPGDRVNPRKDTFLFGARGSREELALLPAAMILAQIPFAVVFIWTFGWKMALLLTAICAVNYLYNLPKNGWRGRPPLELLNQAGYLLILPMSVWLNSTPQVPWIAVVYLVLFCSHSHLMGEVMDVQPDAAVGRWTTARVIGVLPSKIAITTLVFIEGLLLGFHFHDWILGGFLLLGCLWLLLDMLVLFGGRPFYTPVEIWLFGVGINISGFASMAWVWWVGTLMRS